jgi:hypothetical protein
MTRNIKLKNFTVNGNWIHTIHVLKHLENHLITTIALGKLVYIWKCEQKIMNKICSLTRYYVHVARLSRIMDLCSPTDNKFQRI